MSKDVLSIDLHNSGLNLYYFSSLLDGLNENSENKNIMNVISYIESKNGIMGFLKIEENHYNDNINNYLLSSISVSKHIRKKGYSGKLLEAANNRLDKYSIVSRTSPGSNTPKEFTDFFSKQMKQFENTTYLSNKASHINYKKIFPNISKLNKKDRCNIIKNINESIETKNIFHNNKDYIEKINNIINRKVNKKNSFEPL